MKTRRGCLLIEETTTGQTRAPAVKPSHPTGSRLPPRRPTKKAIRLGNAFLAPR